MVFLAYASNASYLPLRYKVCWPHSGGPASPAKFNLFLVPNLKAGIEVPITVINHRGNRSSKRSTYSSLQPN